MARNTFVAADVLTAAQMNTLQNSVWSDDVNAQTGTSYTLVITDQGKQVTMSNAAASVLTIPPNSSVAFTVGNRIQIIQLGAGAVTLTAGAGVTVSSAPASLVMVQNQIATLIKTATNTWVVQKALEFGSVLTNSAVGYQALNAITTGSESTAVGYQASALQTTATNNTSLGYQALNAVTANYFGQSNHTAVGYQALKLATGFGSTAVGSTALSAATTGYSNSAFGQQALLGLTTGTGNVAVGIYAAGGTTTASGNVAVGNSALQSATTGSYNTAVGGGSAVGTTGAQNSALGYNSLGQNSSGTTNTAVGYEALYALQTGSNNSGLGYAAAASSTSVSNTVTLGNSSIATLRCQVTSITSLSDERDKANIEESQYGLELVEMLRPVTFEWNMRDGGKVGQKDIGFIAQDLVAVEDALNAHGTLALTYRDNPDKLEASYGRLVPVLVKAIQELSDKITKLEEQVK